MSAPVYQFLITRTDNRPNKPFAFLLADYITVHMTGNRNIGAGAYQHALWAYNSAPHSWHFTGDDGEIWQSLEEIEQGWHAGDGLDGTGNTRSIGWEICMNADIDQETAYDIAAWHIAELRRRGHGRLGIVQHNHWTGKNCPELIRAELGRWERFLKQVEDYEMATNEELQDRIERLERITTGIGEVASYDFWAGQIAERTLDGRIKYLEIRLRGLVDEHGQLKDEVEMQVNALASRVGDLEEGDAGDGFTIELVARRAPG